jgi:uncharacterized FlaG/YvyC family protein
MAITPVQGSLGLTGLPPLPEDTPLPRSAEKGNRAQLGSPAPRTQPLTQQQSEADLTKLKAVTAQSGLEVRFDTLQGTNVTLIRIVDPATGKVVREFPPEGLAKALAEIRSEATARLNRRNIDRRA